MSQDSTLDQLRMQEYQQRRKVSRLRQRVYEQADPSATPDLLAALLAEERRLSDIEQQRAQAQATHPRGNGLVLDTRTDSKLLGAETTGLDAQVHLRMAQVPTAICHLMSAADQPLLHCRVRNAKNDGGTRRVRVISFIDGYSAHAVDTVELRPLAEHTFQQLPTLFPERIREVNELTRATLNVMLEDIDSKKVELHKTEPIWLLARTTAPLAVMDPQSGQWQDMTPYFGAFVTPNAPALMTFLRLAAERHPDGALVGYQGDEHAVEPQVKAIFYALKADAQIRYVNSVVEFNPEEGAANQRVRLPRESLADREANCIDGTVLFASLLEGISMSPAIVVVPGHAFVAWETWPDSNTWRYLETTMIGGTTTFEQACASAESTAKRYQELAESQNQPSLFRRWPLHDLRTTRRITPME
jgi:hypothetical protein